MAKPRKKLVRREVCFVRRIYELMILVKPVEEGLYKEINDWVVEKIKSFGGELLEPIDEWGKRKLAYPVEKFKEGYYTVFLFALPPENLEEFKHLLKINGDILRFMLLRKEKLEKKYKDKLAVTETTKE